MCEGRSPDGTKRNPGTIVRLMRRSRIALRSIRATGRKPAKLALSGSNESNLRWRTRREYRSPPKNRPQRQDQGADHRLRHSSQSLGRGLSALSEQSLVGLRADLWRALAPRLCQRLSLSEGAAAGVAPRLVAARRRTAGQQLRVHAEAAPRFLRHRIWRDESAVALGAGRAERRILSRAGLCLQRIPAQSLERARSAAQVLAGGALRGPRSLAQGNPPPCRRPPLRPRADAHAHRRVDGPPPLLADL